jgi:zinc and cadmium transporter
VSTLLSIVVAGVLMSAIALVGSVTLMLSEAGLRRIILPLVSLSAGTLLGGAFLHMLPTALRDAPSPLGPYLWVLAGFAIFFALEQFLHWHHCHRAATDCRKPLGYLILIGDGLHNFLGGLAVAGTFLIDIRLGWTTWIAAAAHEIPQEFGDFGVLLHSGWSRKKALVFNVVSALTFLVGGLLAYVASFRIDTAFLVPLAAGNFIYIAASDLVPEVNRHGDARSNVLHFACFVAGLGLMALLRLA